MFDTLKLILDFLYQGIINIVNLIQNVFINFGIPSYISVLLAAIVIILCYKFLYKFFYYILIIILIYYILIAFGVINV